MLQYNYTGESHAQSPTAGPASEQPSIDITQLRARGEPLAVEPEAWESSQLQRS